MRACGSFPWRGFAAPDQKASLTNAFSLHFPVAILAVFFVTYSILWVFANLHFVDFPQVLVPIAHPIMLFQSWQVTVDTHSRSCSHYLSADVLSSSS
jgi:hypothetical protein